MKKNLSNFSSFAQIFQIFPDFFLLFPNFWQFLCCQDSAPLDPPVAMPLFSRVIHEKSNFKFLTSSSVILFIKVIKYIMQNFNNFEKSLEGAISVSNFVHKVNEILEIKMFPAILSHF